ERGRVGGGADERGSVQPASGGGLCVAQRAGGGAVGRAEVVADGGVAAGWALPDGVDGDGGGGGERGAGRGILVPEPERAGEAGPCAGAAVGGKARSIHRDERAPGAGDDADDGVRRPRRGGGRYAEARSGRRSERDAGAGGAARARVRSGLEAGAGEASGAPGEPADVCVPEAEILAGDSRASAAGVVARGAGG